MVKVLRRRERRVLFGIEERNAGKSADLSSIRDDEPRTKDSLAARMAFTTGCYLRKPSAGPHGASETVI